MTKVFMAVIALFILTILPSAPAGASDQGDAVINELVGGISTEVEKIRGLDFYAPLKSEVISADELMTYLTSELNEQVPPEKEKAIELVYGQLGLIPAGTKFVDTYKAMYEQQASGIYDWRGNRMLIVASNLPGLSEDGEIGGGMLSLLGVDPDVLLKTVLSHELCHALEDQHFQFNQRFKEIQKMSSSDREFALQALVEGSATHLMMAYLTGGKPMTPLQRNLNSMLTNIMTDLSMDLPLYFKRSLTAPYTIGEGFVNYVITNDDGWRAVNAAFEDIPASMEQVLHPAQYFNQRDYPSEIQLADFKDKLGAGAKDLLQDTLGEMVIDILLDVQLKRDDFQDAPAGWDGDRLAGIQGADGEVTIVWHSVWDTPNDADEFSAALLKYITAELGETAINHGQMGNQTKVTDSGGREYIIGTESDEVILIDHAPAGLGAILYTMALCEDVVVRK